MGLFVFIKGMGVYDVFGISLRLIIVLYFFDFCCWKIIDGDFIEGEMWYLVLDNMCVFIDVEFRNVYLCVLDFWCVF